MKKRLVMLVSILVIAFILAVGFYAGAQEKLVIGQVFWGLHDSYQQAHQVLSLIHI